MTSGILQNGHYRREETSGSNTPHDGMSASAFLHLSIDSVHLGYFSFLFLFLKNQEKICAKIDCYLAISAIWVILTY